MSDFYNLKEGFIFMKQCSKFVIEILL